ncbi:MAG TPA: tyrosine-type recombinase/integrase [Micromonosporaceae bacterium]|nr:tyrosine-type recombinase/integrase [Micromonosporaceae bacterium]
MRFHDLRQTLLARGVSPRVVMDILGHSQIAVTMNIYAHVIPVMQQDARRAHRRSAGPTRRAG